MKKFSILKKIWRFVAKHKILSILFLALVSAVITWRVIVTIRAEKPETAIVQKGEVSEELILSGGIAATENASLSFQGSGELSWLGVNEGQTVSQGQVLAKLDTVSLNAAYMQALSNLRAAEATLQRVYDSVKNHADDETFSQKETRTAAEVAKDNAYEAVKIAGKNLNNASLKSPFNGIVSEIAYPYSGINTVATQPIIKVVNLETLYFEVSADQIEINKISTGQKVSILLDSFAQSPLEGEVEYVSYTPKEGEVGTVYKVKVKITNIPFEKSKLRVGMIGDAKFILSTRGDVLYLPPKFVNSDQKGRYVNLGKKNNKVYVEVGIESESRIEIKGKVNEGETVYD